MARRLHRLVINYQWGGGVGLTHEERVNRCLVDWFSIPKRKGAKTYFLVHYYRYGSMENGCANM
jgi:hypothetical protein